MRRVLLLACAVAAVCGGEPHEGGYFTMYRSTIWGVNKSTIVAGQELRYLPNSTIIKCSTASTRLAVGSDNSVEMLNVSWPECTLAMIDICANKKLIEMADTTAASADEASTAKVEMAGGSLVWVGVLLAVRDPA